MAGTISPYVVTADPISTPRLRHRAGHAPGFSLLELLVSIAVIALLLSMLIPLLSRAREAGYRAVCANNLRQLSIGWQGYLQDHKDTFPVAAALPEWTYGGVTFHGIDQQPRLDVARPINKYLANGSSTDAGDELSKMFRCPGDTGVWRRTTTNSRGVSILGQSGGESCFGFFGNSYCANPMLMDSATAGVDSLSRALRLSDIQVDTSRLLISADAAWRYAQPSLWNSNDSLEASWHFAKDSGNFLAADGSIRFTNFVTGFGREYTVSPRP
jgi:prepilin-type N-terminal cleavage/methylation domain-containing protein